VQTQAQPAPLQNTAKKHSPVKQSKRINTSSTHIINSVQVTEVESNSPSLLQPMPTTPQAKSGNTSQLSSPLAKTGMANVSTQTVSELYASNSAQEVQLAMQAVQSQLTWIAPSFKPPTKLQYRTPQSPNSKLPTKKNFSTTTNSTNSKQTKSNNSLALQGKKIAAKQQKSSWHIVYTAHFIPQYRETNRITQMSCSGWACFILIWLLRVSEYSQVHKHYCLSAKSEACTCALYYFCPKLQLTNCPLTTVQIRLG